MMMTISSAISNDSEHSLRDLNTFAMPVNAAQIVFAQTHEALLSTWQLAEQQQKPFLLLGEGSNVLFLADFTGYVVFNRLRGIEISHTPEHWLLHVAAGENWHQLVCHTLKQGISGLENLALIPGCVGSAPIQNIGAYGLEFKEICDYVALLDLRTGQLLRLTAAECQFGYRDSIFKHDYRQGFAIVAVGLRLAKYWQARLNYGDLKTLNSSTTTAQQIFDCVCEMRRSKLPDPNLTGNAGSFFKNPLISASQLHVLLQTYPNAPHYPQPDGREKLAAGWLIDQCQLKGYQIGGAAVHKDQALVLINQHNATPADIVTLAKYVRDVVRERFSVALEPEVRFIGANGECNAIEAIS